MDLNAIRMTPIVTLKYLYLHKPDEKYDPKYQVTLVFDGNNKAHKAYMDNLNEANTEAGQELLKEITKGRNAYRIKEIFRPEEDDDGNLTGRYLLKATTKKKPMVVDAQGQVIPDSILSKIGYGSEGRAILYIKPSTVSTQRTVGLTIYLSKVQVTKFLERPEGSSGFGAVEGGFNAADVAPQNIVGQDCDIDEVNF